MEAEDVAKVAVTTDLWEPICLVALQLEFPPQATRDNVVVNDRS